MKSSKSASEFCGSELSLRSQNSLSPTRHRQCSSSRNRTSRSESARSLSSSSSKELRSSLNSPSVGSAISSKAAAVTSRLYPRTDGGFSFLKKGFYDVRFNETLKTRPPCDCHQGKSRSTEPAQSHPFLRKSSSTPRFTGRCGSSCTGFLSPDAGDKPASLERQDVSQVPKSKSAISDLDSKSCKPCERWRSHSGDAERRLRQLDDISRRSAQTRHFKPQHLSCNASDSESSSPDGGRTSSLGGCAFDGPEPPGFREAVQLIGGDCRLGNHAFFKRRTPIRQLSDERGLSASSSFKLVSSSSPSPTSSHRRQTQLSNRRRRPPVRSIPARDESRPSSSLSGRSSSISGIRSRSSSQLSYNEDVPTEDEDKSLSREFGSPPFMKLIPRGSAVELKSPNSHWHSRGKKNSNILLRTKGPKSERLLGKRIEKPRRASLKRLLQRPRIAIKKRTLFLSYMVTHGSGVLVGSQEFAKRTGFAQINALGKLVNSLCRMSDSDLSDGTPFHDGQSSHSQLDESKLGGDGTLVPYDESKENSQDASSDEASPLRSESVQEEADITLLDGDKDSQTCSSLSEKSCDKDSLYDDADNEVNLQKDTQGSRGSSSRAASGLTESSIEINQQSYGYNDGFLLQSFLSRSFSLENYRSQERAVTSSIRIVPDGDSDDCPERSHSLREINFGDANGDDFDVAIANAVRDGICDNGRSNPVAGFSRLPEFIVKKLGQRKEEDHTSVRNEISLVSSFDQRRDEFQGQHDRHLAEYTIAYGDDQSAPLNIQQYGHKLSQDILESGVSELGGDCVAYDGRLEQAAEELARSIISSALKEIADKEVTVNLEEISTQMSAQIIKESQESATNIGHFAHSVSCDIILSSLHFLARDGKRTEVEEEKGNTLTGSRQLVGRELRNLAPNMERADDQFVDSWTLSPEESLGEDNENDSIEEIGEEHGEEEEELVELSDLPIIEKTQRLPTVDACVGSSECIEDDFVVYGKVVADACTQTGFKEVNPSPALDDRYLENQWYPCSENEEGNHIQDAVTGIWTALSQELKSNSQFLRSEELLEYFSESGGLGDAADASSSISLRDHLQSQLSSSVDVTIPRSLGCVSLAEAASSSRRGFLDETDVSSPSNFGDVATVGIVTDSRASKTKNASPLAKRIVTNGSEGFSSPLSLSSYADLPPQLSLSASKPLRRLVDLNSTMDNSLSASLEGKDGERSVRRDEERSSNIISVDSDEDLERRVARILKDTHEDILKYGIGPSRSKSATNSSSSSRQGKSLKQESRRLPSRSSDSFVEVGPRKGRKGFNTTESSIEPISSSVASTSLESLSLCYSGTDPPETNHRRLGSPEIRKKDSFLKKRGSLGKALRDSDGVSTEEEMLRRMISRTDRILLETLDSDSDMSSLTSMGAATRKEDSGIFSTKCSAKKTKKTRSSCEMYTSSPLPNLSDPCDVIDATHVAPFPVLRRKATAAANSSSILKLDLTRLGLDGSDEILPRPRGALSARPKLETAYDEDELIVKAKSSLRDDYAFPDEPPISPFTSNTLPRVKSHYDRIDSKSRNQHLGPRRPTYATLTKSFVALPSGHLNQKAKHLSPKEHRIILANIRKSLVDASKDLDRIS